MNQKQDKLIGLNHDLSIDLANEFARAWRGTNLSNVVDTLDAYIEARRRVPIDPNTGKRYGSDEAYYATQGHYV